ncbi:hypothetical protein QFZ82_004595 [Streptomyces sp. V4I23]|nr:hypothetical protein [Streptomyces sp. V4I23]
MPYSPARDPLGALAQPAEAEGALLLEKDGAARGERGAPVDELPQGA